MEEEKFIPKLGCNCEGCEKAFCGEEEKKYLEDFYKPEENERLAEILEEETEREIEHLNILRQENGEIDLEGMIENEVNRIIEESYEI